MFESLAPKPDFHRTSDIFAQGLAIIRGCWWILAIPLMGQALLFAASLMSGHAPPINIAGAIRQFPSRFLDMFVPLSLFVNLLLHHFFASLLQLYAAMISPFSSQLIAGICLLAAAVVLWNPKLSRSVLPLPDIGERRKRFIGVVSWLGGLILLITFVLSFFTKTSHLTKPAIFYWVRYQLLILMALPAGAFAGALLLGLMNFAADGEKPSIEQAASRAAENFLPLLYFGITTFVLIHLACLPWIMDSYLSMAGHRSALSGSSWWLPEMASLAVASFFTATISFIPAIAVVRRESFVSAFHHCVDLWACYPWAATRFVLFGVLLLAFLSILEPLFRAPPTGNIVVIAPNFFSFLRIIAGVLIMSSMVVFYKVIQQSEKEVP
jgi:hypothetical protein